MCATLLLPLCEVGLACAMSLTTAAAQAPAPPAKRPAAPAPDVAAERQYVFAVLHELVQRTATFADRRMAILVEAQVADQLWPYDQARARKYFAEAWEATKSATGSMNVGIHFGLSASVGLQSQLIPMISRHDSRWADTLWHSVDDNAQNKDSRWTASDRSIVIQAMVNDNPQAATQLLESNLKPDNPFSILLQPVLQELRERDPEAADGVMRHAIESFLQSPAATYDHVLDLCQFVGSLHSRGDPNATAILRAYLSAAQPVILRDAAQRGSGYAIYNNQRVPSPNPSEQTLLALYDQYMPEAAPLIHTKLSWVPPMGPAQAASWYRSDSDKLHTNVAELVEQAKAAPTEREGDSLYAQAALALAAGGDVEGALLQAANVRNEVRRKDLQLRISETAARQALARGDLDAAYRYARDQERGGIRVALFVEIIKAALAKKDVDRATALLAEIERSVRTTTALRQDPHSWFRLAEAAIAIDQARGFLLMQEVVRAINEAEFTVANQRLKPEYQETLRREYLARVEVDNLEYKPSFLLLGRLDFARALALARSIQAPEPSAFAQLAVCEGALKKTDTRPKSPPRARPN